MKKKSSKILLISLVFMLLLGLLAGCGGNGAGQTVDGDPLQVKVLAVLPSAYVNEAFDLRDIILMEEGVEYSATASYVETIFDETTSTFTSEKKVLEVKDLCYTPVEVTDTVVTITATRNAEKASKVVIIPTVIRADPLDDLLKSDGPYGAADGGITKSVNNDPAFIQGENSATSLHVVFNTMDPHPWGNTFISVHSEEVQRHFSDQTWKNAILTFWVYNPNDQAIEFQLRLADDVTKLNVDWNNAEGPHKQIAPAGQWTQIFFPLRKLGVQNRITHDEYHSCAVNLKFRYETYSTTESYSFNFYLDNLDVVDGSMYPEIDNGYVLSDENLNQGWENLAQDIGWQGVYTEYNYENVQGENSTCSLKAFFNNDKALTNSFICLSPEGDERIDQLPDMTGGKLSAYFKFENMDPRVSLDIINSGWSASNEVDFALTDVGNGWYYGEVDLETVQVGTGLNDNIIRIRLKFHGVSKTSVVYVDTCKFEYKYVHKVLESVSADWINMTPDMGPFYYVGTAGFVTTHLHGDNTVRSLKLVAPADNNGKYTLHTDTGATNGEISAIPNMTKGTLGAWFYFGDQAPAAYVALTNDLYRGSNGVDFVFTQNDGNGWYYGELHASNFKCAEGGGTSKIIRISILIPAGYTVYIDNLHWNPNVENELVGVDVPKPAGPNAAFQSGEDTTVMLDNMVKLVNLSFKYKINSGTKFAMALMPDWTSYFGYYDFNATGADGTYNGVTTEVLEDGYVQVNFDLTALDNLNGAPETAITMLYIRGIYTDASGVIENIQWTVDENAQPDTPADPDIPVDPNVPSYEFAAGAGATIMLENDQSIQKMSFDYKFTSGNKMVVALMPDWENYFGFFEFHSQGLIDPCDGVTVYALENGYYRVVFDMTAVNKASGNPSDVLTMIYVHGGYTAANGVITNICLNDAVEVPEITDPPVVEPEGQQYAVESGKDLIVNLDAVENLTSLSFDYKVTGGNFYVALLQTDWLEYFGYFAFNENGKVDPDDGVTVEVLDNGYTRVVLDIAALTKMSGTPEAPFTVFYIRGAWTEANGVITNICLNTSGEAPEVTEPSVTEPEATEPPATEPEATEPPVEIEEHVVEAGKDLIVNLEALENLTTLSFDYKVTGGNFYVALLQTDWLEYFGYFAFNENGKVDPDDGVTVQALDNGYTRVVLDIAALTKMSGTPEAPFTVFYIRGAWTEANGVITNICLNDAVEVPSEPSVTEPEATEPPATEPPATEPPVEAEEYVMEAGKDLIVNLEALENLTTLRFDYKVTEGTFNMALLQTDWQEYFGYFAFDANGKVDPYDGVTVEKLDNGYTRVVLDIAALTKMSGTPEVPLTVFYIRGNWTDANGIITNIFLNDAVEEPTEPSVTEPPATEPPATEPPATEPPVEIEEHVVQAGKDLIVNLEAVENPTTLSFDYKVTGGTFNMALLQTDWQEYFGYFAFDANGNVDAYDGVTVQALDDGYTRVVLDIAALTKMSGTPEAPLTVFYVRGAWTDTDGIIRNIRMHAGEAPNQVFEGASFAAGAGATIAIDNAQPVTKLTFDYKIIDGNKFNLALLPDWSAYFGYFAFDAQGTIGSYDGISVKQLADGYVRVYVDLQALTVKVGVPSNVLTILYIRGEDWTDANGTITNIRINDAAEAAMRGKNILAKAKLLNPPAALPALAADYKIIDGEKIASALMPNWLHY